MRYAIEYEHLKEELVTDQKTEWYFNRVKDSANKFRLELSDEDFKRFLKLERADRDVRWFMHIMSAYNRSFIDVLITYITD